MQQCVHAYVCTHVCLKACRGEQLLLSEASYKHVPLFTKHVQAIGFLRNFNLGSKHEAVFVYFYVLLSLSNMDSFSIILRFKTKSG